MDSGTVVLNGKKFEVLLAISDEEQSKGLMYVDPPVPNMAFIYGASKINKFWMNNTKAPLDIVFCNNNKVISICYGEPYSTKIIGGNDPSDLVVEFPAGNCNFFGIKAGDQIELLCENNSLMKVFMLKNGFHI